MYSILPRECNGSRMYLNVLRNSIFREHITRTCITWNILRFFTEATLRGVIISLKFKRNLKTCSYIVRGFKGSMRISRTSLCLCLLFKIHNKKRNVIFLNMSRGHTVLLFCHPTPYCAGLLMLECR